MDQNYQITFLNMNFIPTEDETYQAYEGSDNTVKWIVGLGVFVIAVLFIVFARSDAQTQEKREITYSGSVQQSYDQVIKSASGVVNGFEQSRKDCNALATNVSKLKDKGLTVTSEAFDKEFTICDSVAYASNKLSGNTNTGSER